MPKRQPQDAPGIIVIAQANAEILRRQCEASAHANRNNGTAHKVQLIPLSRGMACIRIYGNFPQFTALLNSLKFPDSGWKPQSRALGWWKQYMLCQASEEPMMLYLVETGKACALLNLSSGERRTADMYGPNFISQQVNPDTLQFLECTSFE